MGGNPYNFIWFGDIHGPKAYEFMAKAEASARRPGRKLKSYAAVFKRLAVQGLCALSTGDPIDRQPSQNPITLQSLAEVAHRWGRPSTGHDRW